MTLQDTRLEQGSGSDGGIDEARVQAFAERLTADYSAAMLTLMLDVGARTGLLDALADADGTSADIAARASLDERYTRECLGALVTGGVVDYDAGTGRYRLPGEHAACLTGNASSNLAPVSRIVTLLAGYVPEVADAFRTGGGVSYERFRPDFTGVMDGLSRGWFDAQLVDGVLPLAGDLPAKLASGIRVADIGCGTGHSTNLLARAYPASTFVGYDLAADALERGRLEAREYGLGNVTFEVRDVAQLPDTAVLDAVFAFDAVHDQADPAAVLAEVHRVLAPGGVFVMLDIRASSRLEENVGNPAGPLLYGMSTLYCMTVSLAEGGAGLGTMWGEQLARQMLADAGFVDVAVHDAPDDPLDSVYVARPGPR